METRKSEFDKPIGLYHLIQEIRPNDGGPIQYNNLVNFINPDYIEPTALPYFLNQLEMWGWIKTDKYFNVLRLTRPTENIYLVPRPIQEVLS